MPDTIRDGKGRGFLVGVDDDNRLLVNAKTIPEEANIAISDELTFGASSAQLTLSSTNPHAIFYLQNNDSTKDLFISVVTYSYNGGDTNHNRTMFKELIKNPNAPTANYTTATSSNLNFASVKDGLYTVYVWDGVGDGMTMTGGTAVLNSIVPNGTLIYQEVYSIVVGFQDAIAWRFTGQEVGKVAISMRFYFK